MRASLRPPQRPHRVWARWRGTASVSLAFGLLVGAHPCLAQLTSASGELRIEPDGQAVGTFDLESANGDLRESPGTAALAVAEDADPAGAGSLTGSALRVNEARRVDPTSGRPLLGDASAGSVCVTGSEPACLPPDHCQPTAAGPLTPCSIAASVGAFEAINGWSIGFNDLDQNAGGLTIWNSTTSALTGTPIPLDEVLSDPFEISISELLVNAVAGNRNAGTAVSQGLAGAFVPFTPLNQDPCDGFLADCVTPGPAGSVALSAFGALTANQVLTSQQQALLGCGEFYGASLATNCEATGLAFLNSEASALLQCLPDLDPNRDYGDPDPDVDQPCTVGFQVGPACTRFANGQTFILPGCRGPDDPGYDPNVDGSNTNLFQPLIPGFQLFRSEMAAASMNFILLLVALSSPEDPSNPQINEFDASDPTRLDGCSFRKPQLCGNVRSFFAFPGTLTTEAVDDPSGPPKRRWVWETGADYEITSASGSLADFDGWSFHALGPELSRAEESELGVQFVLGPPEDQPPCEPPPFTVPESILIDVGPEGCDGVTPSPDDRPLGLAYGLVPEPSALAQGFVALGLLAWLARWRRGRRRGLISPAAPTFPPAG